MAGKRRIWISIKNFLKSLNCCRSQCFNKTIENINIEHIEGLYNAINELQVQITQLTNAPKISMI